jgi:DNA-directed RNA polymerase subunit alpha
VHLATLERTTKLELCVTVGCGRAYHPAEENTSADQPLGVIADRLDLLAGRVAYAVAPARVGQRSDYDTLTLDIDR